MKKLLDKLRTKSFWVAAVGAFMLVLTRYIEISVLAERIADAVGSLLVLIGIAPVLAHSESGDPSGADGQTDPETSDDGEKAGSDDEEKRN